MTSSKPEYTPTTSTLVASKVVIANKDPRMENVTVELENLQLWQEFCDRSTEMILTKLGRRMFPDLKFTIRGLERDQYYFVVMDIVPTDEFRYKFVGGCWMPAYKSDAPPHKSNLYTHPDSPALGAKWISMTISFNKLKLTNNASPKASGSQSSENIMVLNSMHRYTPRLHIFRGSDIAKLDIRNFTTYSFPVTSFMAVTAYQNAEVTNLKIKFNPFAKGFRDDDRRQPLKRSYSEANLGEDSDRASTKSSRSDQENRTIQEDRAGSVGGLTPPTTPLSEVATTAAPRAELPPTVANPYPTYDTALQLPMNPFDHRLVTPPAYPFPQHWRDIFNMYPQYMRHWLATGVAPYPNAAYFAQLDQRYGYPGV